MNTTLSPEAVLKGRNAAFDRAIQAATGRPWSYERQLIEEGLCPEIVPIVTEDGPTDGRCRLPIEDGELAACNGHAAEIRGWRAMSEMEKAAWERRADEEGMWR